MKKTVVCFVLAVGIAVSLSSCSSTQKMVLDKNVPEDQTTTVTFVDDSSNGYFVVKEWNDNNIQNELYGGRDSLLGKAILTVPVGTNSFTFNMYFSNSNTRYTLENLQIRYEMKPGIKYQIKGTTKSLGLFKGYEVFIGIYDADSNTLLKEWKLGEAK